jgi:hypothetical protein
MTIYCVDIKKSVTVSQHQGRPYCGESYGTRTNPSWELLAKANVTVQHIATGSRLVWEAASGQ